MKNEYTPMSNRRLRKRLFVTFLIFLVASAGAIWWVVDANPPSPSTEEVWKMPGISR